MKFTSSLLLGASLLLPSVFAHPFDLPFKLSNDEILNLDNTLARRASGIVDTVGIPGTVYPRYEIRQLQSEYPQQFALFVLAMQKWETASQSDVTGYFQVAGIHGDPRVNYNNVGPCSGCNTADGYCTHNVVLFPAWHRTYMALFEQELHRVAVGIANAWPVSGQAYTRAQMQTAAKQLKLPYWDWAALPPNNGPMFPDCLSSTTLTIQTQKGQQTITNPLYSYKIQNPSGLVYSNFTSWDNTLRYPYSDTPSTTSNEQACIAGLNNVRPSLQDSLYSLFTTCNNYLYFSNAYIHKIDSSDTCQQSIEGIHNTVHAVSGGVPTKSVPIVGHMFYLPEAAFDPIFWLHHAMVDRSFAMWQTLYPNSYGASMEIPKDTWTAEANSTQGPTSPLTPFYKSGSTFWTTDMVQDWTQFGYTYPEFVDSSGSSSAIASYVNKLYGPSATATAGSSKRTAAAEPVHVAAEPTPEPVLAERGIFSPPKGALAANGSSYQYTAAIQAPRYALNGPYYVFVFLGQPASSDPSTWITDANLVGPMAVLSAPGSSGDDYLIHGSIPLTRALTKKLGSGSGLLSQLSEDLVGPFLQNLLSWQILGPDGETVDPTTLDGFLVSVFANTATIPNEIGSLPEYSQLIPLSAATHGKKGGLIGSLLGELGL